MGPAYPTLEQFRSLYESSHEAFNRHDFRAAFAAAPTDMEYRAYRPLVGAPTLRGPHQCASYFEDALREFPDWRTKDYAFEEVGEGVIVVHFTVLGTGRSSGLMVESEIWQAWDFRGDHLVVNECESRAAALAAAGLGDTGAAEPDSR